MGTPDDELVEVIDERGTVVRLATRAEMRAGNLRHRTVGVVVLTSAGDLVAHRRATWKDVWPGRWDVCFGGVTGVGEDWRVAARRELAEESGVDVPPEHLHDLGSGTFSDADVSVLARIFVVTHDGPFTPADGEVAELAFVPLDDLAEWLGGRDLCADTEALTVPLLADLARGDAPAPPSRDGG